MKKFLTTRGSDSRPNLAVLICCALLGIIWGAVYCSLDAGEALRWAITTGEVNPASLLPCIICYSFVHADGAVLLLNCAALTYMSTLVAKRCSVSDVFRMFSLGGLLGGALYLLASWALRNSQPLCGGHTALMACCTAMVFLDPGREVGQSSRGKTMVICSCLFLGGWLSGKDNLYASFIAMTAGLGAGAVYGAVIRSMGQDQATNTQ